MPEFVRIPGDRVGVLIGSEGETKKMLENRCNVKLEITGDGGVTITAKDEDGLREWKALDIVKAIGRGFNPRYAVALLKEDYALTIIDLYEIFRHKDSDVKRVKSRIIGESGKAWQTIEDLTNTKMSVYGRTIGIIGLEDDIVLCEQAISMLIKGAQHQSVYAFLERGRKIQRTGV